MRVILQTGRDIKVYISPGLFRRFSRLAVDKRFYGVHDVGNSRWERENRYAENIMNSASELQIKLIGYTFPPHRSSIVCIISAALSATTAAAISMPRRLTAVLFTNSPMTSRFPATISI